MRKELSCQICTNRVVRTKIVDTGIGMSEEFIKRTLLKLYYW